MNWQHLITPNIESKFENCIGKTPAPELPDIAEPAYWPMGGPSDDSAVNPGRFISFLLSAIEIRRHLSDEERKLFGHVNARKKLLANVCVAVGECEDDVYNFSSRSQC